MKLKNRLHSLMALLFVGSASLQAQDDPFGDFNPWLYQSNMTITAQVVQNGNVVTEGVVAVYCRDELRGKKNVGNDPNNPNLVYLQVYANSTGSYDQNLHFKVYTGGRVFTFTPDPAIYWKNNDAYGTTATPYIIDITPVSLANDADNTSVVTTWNTKTCDVVLSDRTLYHDGAWNTLCLPFDVDAFTGTPLEGAIVKTLESTDFSNGTLTMNFTADNANLTQMEAGKPYIVKWTSGVNDVNPVFSSVTIKNVTDNIVPTTYADFVGTHSSVVFDAGTAHKDVLFLGGGSNLYYPDGQNATTIGACRAYFTLKNGLTAGDPATGGGIKSFVLNFGDDTETGIFDGRGKTEDGRGENTIYNLAGQRLNKAQRGVNIINGGIVIIK